MTSLFGHKAKETLALSYPDWESMADEEQTSVPHHRCEDTGMTDHKARLYIKYTDGAYVFMCHNCGVHGMYRPKERTSIVRDEIPAPDKHRYTHGLWDKWLTLPITKSPPLWLLEHGFGADECWTMRITYDATGIYLPLVDNTCRRTVGVQRRNFKGSPKYTTEVNEFFQGFTCYQKGNKTLYITEDVLSAMKLTLAGKDSLAVLGTKTPTNMPKGYDEVVIWLDDDAAGHKGTINMARELSALYPKVTTLFDKEAKTWPLEKLKMLP
jgi:hypothetical protein